MCGWHLGYDSSTPVRLPVAGALVAAYADAGRRTRLTVESDRSGEADHRPVRRHRRIPRQMPKSQTRPRSVPAAAEPTLQNLLYQASREAVVDLGRVVGSKGMPVASWRALEVLSDEQGRTMSVLAAETGMLMPATSKLVDRMIDAALIQRSIDPADNRRVVLHISDLGLAKVAELKDELQARRDWLQRKMTPARVRQLRSLLLEFIRVQQSSR